jgi:hypothetical protein
MAPKADAAQRTIIAQMDACIVDHGLAKQKLDACVLPGGLACGSSPDVVHVHHTALCTLVGGQRILLQERRDRMEQDMIDDDALRAQRSAPAHEGGDEPSLFVDRKRGVLRANGPAAIILAVCVAVGVVLFFMHKGG